MRCVTLIFLFAALVGMTTASTARADLIAYWNFNGLVNNTNNGIIYAPNMGAGLIVLDGWTSAGLSAKMGTTNNAIPPDPAGQALGLEGMANNGAHLVFSFNMAGLMDPILTFDQRRNDFGFDSIQASWSTDAVTWFDFGLPFSPPTGVFGLQSLDFSSINALDGTLTAFVRLTFAGATENFGRIRFDNPQINAVASTSIPEPSVVLSSGALLGLMLLVGLRRRK